MKNDRVRKHLLFYGRVQGVGFRYRASHAADMLGLTGWVRNLYDGSVECEVQGSEKMIRDFISMLKKGTYIEIDDIRQKNAEVKEKEGGFRIIG